MRTSTLSSLWLRPEAAERKERVKKGVRRKGEREFT
jgi:hypothetical protein